MSQHARMRVQERFHGRLTLGHEFNEKDLKMVGEVKNKKAHVYKYNFKNNPMYLLIGARPPATVITVFTPALYKSWERRFKVITGIKAIGKFLGFGHNKTHQFATVIANAIAPRVDE